MEKEMKDLIEENGNAIMSTKILEFREKFDYLCKKTGLNAAFLMAVPATDLVVIGTHPMEREIRFEFGGNVSLIRMAKVGVAEGIRTINQAKTEKKVTVEENTDDDQTQDDKQAS